MKRDRVIWVVMDGTNNIPVRSFYDKTTADNYVTDLKKAIENKHIRYWVIDVSLMQSF